MERLGVAFTGGLTPPEIVQCVQLAEELGYESAWMAEGHGGDQFSVLTACALATSRIGLGTSISSVFVRSAPTIAMSAACVDYFSGGRFILGLGSSHRVQVGPEHGLPFGQPIPRLRECVDIVRQLLRDGDVSYRGEVFDIQGFDLQFRPLRQEIPIFVAAVFPRMLEICGEIAQGVLLTWCTLEHARAAAGHVATGAERQGKNTSDVEVATLLSCAVGESEASATEQMRAVIANYAARFPRYRRLMEEAGFAEEVEAVRRMWRAGDRQQAMRLVPSGLIREMALVGSVDECRARLQEYRQAGITLPIISPRIAGENAKQQAMSIIRACAPL